MPLVRSSSTTRVRLTKDLVRDIKRGHSWLYSQAVEPAEAASGSVVTVLDRRGDKRIATGIYDPQHPIRVRICQSHPPFQLDDNWIERKLHQALALRRSLFRSDSCIEAQPSGVPLTTGYRLVAGEGDGLPGLVVDVYDHVAVIKLDGGAPENFYQPQGIADWLVAQTGITQVVLRSRKRGRAGQLLTGDLASPPERVSFLENGMQLAADVMHGQKTGFFLDQRDNRAIVRQLALGRRVLNLFSFNGGFSIAAGLGQAQHVTSVDIAQPAIRDAELLWTANHLPEGQHQGVVKDCFAFLESAVEQKDHWNLVICDPPSFAPNEQSRPQAARAYSRLAYLSAKVCQPEGLLALASCSSHIDHQGFSDICQEALGRARRKANLLVDRGLPADHPTPFAMPELRYLKFLLFQLS